MPRPATAKCRTSCAAKFLAGFTFAASPRYCLFHQSDYLPKKYDASYFQQLMMAALSADLTLQIILISALPAPICSMRITTNVSSIFSIFYQD